MSQALAAGPLLSIDGLRFRWPRAAEDTIAIDRFEVAPGEAVFVRGPSGCGKSTLLSLMAGVLTASSGLVQLLGRDWQAMSAAQRDRLRSDHVGYIFQQFNLLPYLSVRDNVLLPCRLSAQRAARAGAAGAGVDQAVERLLEQVGLEATLWTRKADSLSVGQQQRVAAARALVGQPELVIADEPTSALDEGLRDTFMDLLLAACRRAGSSLVFVSHDARLAARFDRQIDLPALNRADVQVSA
jgi:putative ABC transport system ATP-binding protein